MRGGQGEEGNGGERVRGGQGEEGEWRGKSEGRARVGGG